MYVFNKTFDGKKGGGGVDHERVLYLVYVLLHACLEAPHLELYGDELVGAHDGILCVPPAFLQHAARGLLRFKMAQILHMDTFLPTLSSTTGS